jgi:RND family efflux transporter MFP subunit
LRLRQTRVVAPDAGVISARSATLGSVAGVGDELFRMVRQNRMEWHAQIAATDVGRVQIGQTAIVTLPDGTTIEGVVRQIAPLLAQNLTAIAYVQFNKVWHTSPHIGMFVSGAIVTGASNGMSLPSSSIVIRDGREYVFVLDGDSLAKQVQIHSGRRDGDHVEIVSGISPKQSVVATGGGFLHDGDRVRMTPDRQVATR